MDNNNRWQWGLASPRKQLVYSEATCTLNTCAEHSRKAQSQRQRLENQLLKPEAKGCPTLCVETWSKRLSNYLCWNLKQKVVQLFVFKPEAKGCPTLCWNWSKRLSISLESPASPPASDLSWVLCLLGSSFPGHFVSWVLCSFSSPDSCLGPDTSKLQLDHIIIWYTPCALHWWVVSVMYSEFSLPVV